MTRLFIAFHKFDFDLVLRLLKDHRNIMAWGRIKVVVRELTLSVFIPTMSRSCGSHSESKYQKQVS